MLVAGLSVALSMLASCAPDAGPTDDPGLPARLRTESAIAVRITPHPAAGDSRTTDATGLATVGLELALADLPGVVPIVDGAPESPIVDDALRVVTATWALDLQVAVSGEELLLDASLCDPDGGCTPIDATARLVEPGPGLGRVMHGIEQQLGRFASADAASARIAPESADDYAVRLEGRAASVRYGLLPPPKAAWDKRTDPVMRAVLVDPTIPGSGYTAAAMALALDEPGRVAAFLSRPRTARPSSPWLRAVDAAALTALDDRVAAELAWLDLVETWPNDPRFLIPAARQALIADHPGLTERLLVRVPEAAATDPEVARLRAEAAAGGNLEILDARLAEWQAIAPRPSRSSAGCCCVHARIASPTPWTSSPSCGRGGPRPRPRRCRSRCWRRWVAGARRGTRRPTRRSPRRST